MVKVRVRDCCTMDEAVLPGDTRCVRVYGVSEAQDAIAIATDRDEIGMLVEIVAVVRTPRPKAPDYARTVYQGSHFTNILTECVGGTVFVETNATDASENRIWRWCEVLDIITE